MKNMFFRIRKSVYKVHIIFWDLKYEMLEMVYYNFW